MSVAQLIESFNQNGFAVARGLFAPEECDHFSDYFTTMLNRGGDGWAEGGVDFESDDPWRRYPRLLQPHRGDDVALGFMVDPRIRQHLAALCGKDPYAVQTMVYFKPPGAKGQNLHQDNTYLRAEPGTCIAAWLALDDCDVENGCMSVVPGSQGFPILCQTQNESLRDECWGTTETAVPEGMELVNVEMKRGDVLFFNGSLIHGSYKNRSQDRFRRTLIGHYIDGDSRQVAQYYFPVFRMDGTRLDDDEIAVADGGGPCGRIVDGEIVYDGEFEAAKAAH